MTGPRELGLEAWRLAGAEDGRHGRPAIAPPPPLNTDGTAGGRAYREGYNAGRALARLSFSTRVEAFHQAESRSAREAADAVVAVYCRAGAGLEPDTFYVRLESEGAPAGAELLGRYQAGEWLRPERPAEPDAERLEAVREAFGVKVPAVDLKLGF